MNGCGQVPRVDLCHVQHGVSTRDMDFEKVGKSVAAVFERNWDAGFARGLLWLSPTGKAVGM